jgi:hypothetical protein
LIKATTLYLRSLKSASLWCGDYTIEIF